MKYKDYFAHVNVFRNGKLYYSFSDIYSFKGLMPYEVMDKIYSNVIEYGAGVSHNGCTFYNFQKGDRLVITALNELG